MINRVCSPQCAGVSSTPGGAVSSQQAWCLNKVKNIGFDGYMGGYFYMNIDILKINKNTLKFMKILCKSVKIIIIIKYIH